MAKAGLMAIERVDDELRTVDRGIVDAVPSIV